MDTKVLPLIGALVVSIACGARSEQARWEILTANMFVESLRNGDGRVQCNLHVMFPDGEKFSVNGIDYRLCEKAEQLQDLRQAL